MRIIKKIWNKNLSGRRTLWDVKINHSISVLKTVLINQNRSIGHNRSLERDTYKYGNLMYYKRTLLNQEI